MLTPTAAGGRNWRASMDQDLTKGRPTENDYKKATWWPSAASAASPRPSRPRRSIAHCVEVARSGTKVPETDITVARDSTGVTRTCTELHRGAPVWSMTSGMSVTRQAQQRAALEKQALPARKSGSRTL